MKRYLVFAIYDYYPSGGFGDYATMCDTLDGVKDVCMSGNYLSGVPANDTAYEIVDTQLFKSVRLDADKTHEQDFKSLSWKEIITQKEETN